jgi:radical SAM protein with 4Fe4S-binding SPASM domain
VTLRAALGRWRRRLRDDPRLQAVVTELTYRVRRQAVERQLENRSSLPLELHLEATNVCNARCVFCAYPQMERPHASMPMELFERVVDEYVAMGGTQVSLTPIVGDPFVDTRVFERLDVLARRAEISSFHFFTNAILMTPAKSRRLLAYGPRLRICISMGGFDRKTWARLMGVDRFDRVWEHLRVLVEAMALVEAPPRLEVHVRCSPQDCRGAAWDELSTWRSRGRVTVGVIDTYDGWAGKIDDTTLLENGLRPTPPPHRRGACELLYLKPVVLADGRVNACACRDVEAELVVGDVREQGLSEIFAGKALVELRARHERGDFPEVCRRCTYYVSVYNPLKSRL